MPTASSAPKYSSRISGLWAHLLASIAQTGSAKEVAAKTAVLGLRQSVLDLRTAGADVEASDVAAFADGLQKKWDALSGHPLKGPLQKKLKPELEGGGAFSFLALQTALICDWHLSRRGDSGTFNKELLDDAAAVPWRDAFLSGISDNDARELVSLFKECLRMPEDPSPALTDPIIVTLKDELLRREEVALPIVRNKDYLDYLAGRTPNADSPPTALAKRPDKERGQIDHRIKNTRTSFRGCLRKIRAVGLMASN